MKRIILALPLVLAAAACTTQEQSTLGGAAAGAALGAAVSSHNDRGKGLIIGAATGALAGNLIGRSQDGRSCRYSDSYGREYTAACQ